MPTALFNGVKLYYEEAGSGQPLPDHQPDELRRRHLAAQAPGPSDEPVQPLQPLLVQTLVQVEYATGSEVQQTIRLGSPYV